MQEFIQTAPDPEPAPHAYNTPGLSPLEFLRAVMDDTHLLLVSRIQAASALLPFTEPKPRSVVQGYVPYRCRIIIGCLGPPDDPTRNQAASALLPYSRPAPKPVVQGPTITIVIGGLKDPEQINSETQ